MSALLVFDTRGRPIEPPSPAFEASMRDLGAAMRMSLWAIALEITTEGAWRIERRRRIERCDRSWEARS